MLLPFYLNLEVTTSAVLGGKLVFSEAELVAGGEVTTVTLTGTQWSGAFDIERQGIIDGFDAAESELTGWNAEIRDKEVVTAAVRTSDTVVTMTWTASAAYDITEIENITVTIPASATAAGEVIVASNIMQIPADSIGSGKKKKKLKTVN